MRLSNKSATTGFYNKNIYIFCFYLKNCVGLSQSYFLLSLLVIFPIQNFPFKLLGATKKKGQENFSTSVKFVGHNEFKANILKASNVTKIKH